MNDAIRLINASARWDGHIRLLIDVRATTEFSRSDPCDAALLLARMPWNRG